MRINNLIAITLLTISGLSSAKEVIGIGEYRYGPDTPQNLACELAEERAKENALTKFVGEQIDAVIYGSCTNETCEIQRDTINSVKGYIKSISNYSKRTVEVSGYTSCIINFTANVLEIKNPIKLILNEDSYNFKENDEVTFRGLSNKSGNVAVYNYYNGIYRKIYVQTIATPNKEFVIPYSNRNKIVAVLPAGELQSKELVIFLLTENAVHLQDTYTQIEYKNLLSRIPVHQRVVVNRYVYIMR